MAGSIQMTPCRFAAVAEIFSDEFMPIVRTLDALTGKYGLPDHSDLNRARYPWSVGLLNPPELYAARMWEYPFAIRAAQLEPGMQCADVGCGMTPFPAYLREIANCDVTGVDPEVFDAGINYRGHGVSREFVERTGLEVVQSGMEALALPSNAFDRVFCLSVIEHTTAETARRGVQEMARILKPGGRLILTVDVTMHSDIVRPLDLVWESGLIPLGNMDLRWPVRRFGLFCDGAQPADVFGLTLIKDSRHVETQYLAGSGAREGQKVPLSFVPTLRWQARSGSARRHRPASRRGLLRRLASRLKRAVLVLLRG